MLIGRRLIYLMSFAVALVASDSSGQTIAQAGHFQIPQDSIGNLSEPSTSVSRNFSNFSVSDSAQWFGSSEFSNRSINPESSTSRVNSIAGVPVSLGTLWMTDSQTGLSNYSASLKFPILKLFGSPPPIVKAGFTFTDLFASPGLGLPEDLYEYSVLVSGIRPINDRWTVRTMLGVGFATDNENTSSDAWQFRGGAFGIYKRSETMQWSIGAIALGRRDLPVVPAIGAIWTPRPDCRWDLILPNPKVNFLVADDGKRQDWIYFGGGFNGTTWGYESPIRGNDRLTYSDLRVVLGWQNSPKSKPGVPYVKGRKFKFETGYVFSRDLEFDNEQTEVDLDDAVMFQWSTDY